MQINRLFEIIYILLERRTISAKELAERLEVSTRTIYRDVEHLTLAGIPLYTSRGKGGGISVLPGFVMDKALLKAEDKQNILSALNAFSVVHPGGKSEESGRIHAFLGGEAADWIEVDFSSWNSGLREKELFNQLKQCILDKQVVDFAYANGRGEHIMRTVEPLKLGYKGEAWYLYGFCRLRKDFRFFKLSRIRDLNILPEFFVRKAPAKIFPEGRAFEEHMLTLCLKLSSKVFHRVFEEFEQMEMQEDGSAIVTVRYPRGPWLYSYILSFGEECEVLQPLEIREQYRKIVAGILEKYQ